MYKNFKSWTADSTPVMETGASIFRGIDVPSSPVTESLFRMFDNEGFDITRKALEKIMVEFVKVTERQLGDFLEGGHFGQKPSEEVREQLKHCKLTNLVSEYEFGHLDYSQFKRRHASMHFHSGIQMIKMNKTISGWLSQKTEEEQSKLLKIAHEQAFSLRKKHMENEKGVKRKIKEKLEANFRKKQETEAIKLEKKREIVEGVRKHGGPCKSGREVDSVLEMMRTNTQKMDALKKEIRYLKVVLDVKDKRLLFGKKNVVQLTSDLKAVLDIDSISDHVELESSVELVPEIGPAVPPGSNVSRPKRKAPVQIQSQTCKKRKKESKNVQVKNQNKNRQMQEEKFTFKSQGTWVAVAYDNMFFIGQVVKIKSTQQAVVQFLRRGLHDIFTWPEVDDIDKVDSKFVFAHDFDVKMAKQTGSRTGTSWLVPELEYLEGLYRDYAHTYF